jgi:flagellum-specific peptidoglycan hydrolase FlgJ
MIIQQTWIEAAQSVHKALYPRGPFASVTIAQFGDESAWGADASGINNFFGIKATPAQIRSGQARLRMTSEYLNGRYVRLPQYFANYDSVADGFMAHGQLLCQPWYAACMAATTVVEYCQALLKDRYATEPDYPTILMNIIDSFNLKQYDLPPPAPAPVAAAIGD